MKPVVEIEPVSASAYSFRAALRQDLPLLRRWLRTPEVRRWWGDAEEQEALLQEDFDEPAMVMRIVSLSGRAFAYAQDYEVHVWPQPHFAHLPQGSRAIDSFIGEPEMIGCGHGSTYLRFLAERLKAEGAPVVALIPIGIISAPAVPTRRPVFTGTPWSKPKPVRRF